MRRDSPEVGKGTLSARRSFYVYEGAVEQSSLKTMLLFSYLLFHSTMISLFLRIITVPISLSHALWS
jgi:hypothetical protein